MKKTHTDYSVLHRRIKTFPVCRRIKSYKSLVETIPSLLSNPGSNEEAFRMVTPTYVAGGCWLLLAQRKGEERDISLWDNPLLVARPTWGARF